MGRGADSEPGFYPRHPRGWRRGRTSARRLTQWFLSTPPSRVATRCHDVLFRFLGVSIHATLAGGDPPPAGGGPRRQLAVKARQGQFLSTPPSRVATEVGDVVDKSIIVSIHATLAGGDGFLSPLVTGPRLFLSTPPSRVATLARPQAGVSPYMFLSTPPSRVATLYVWEHRTDWTFLSTPPSRVATDAVPNIFYVGEVSIHATLAGGDPKQEVQKLLQSGVSIHATLAGGDLRDAHKRVAQLVFLSTPPSRVATLENARTAASQSFLSTPPSRVATVHDVDFAFDVGVSIHATLAGGDKGAAFRKLRRGVSIHATLAGGDSNVPPPTASHTRFYPRHPRGWRRPVPCRQILPGACFYPRHPRGWRPCCLWLENRQ